MRHIRQSPGQRSNSKIWLDDKNQTLRSWLDNPTSLEERRVIILIPGFLTALHEQQTHEGESAPARASVQPAVSLEAWTSSCSEWERFSGRCYNSPHRRPGPRVLPAACEGAWAAASNRNDYLSHKLPGAKDQAPEVCDEITQRRTKSRKLTFTPTATSPMLRRKEH